MSKDKLSADLKPACGRLKNPAKAAGHSAVRIAFGFPQRLNFGFFRGPLQGAPGLSEGNKGFPVTR
jgi:hypothetical protein